MSYLPARIPAVGRVADLVSQRAQVGGLVRWAAPLQYELAVDGLDVGQVDRRTGLHCREERKAPMDGV